MDVRQRRGAIERAARQDRGRRERIARDLGVERDPESSEAYSEEVEAVMVDEVVQAEDQAGATVEAAAADGAASELAALREHLVTLHKDAVPELIGGASVGELLGSVAGAQAAYRAVVASVVPSVPAGGGARPVGVAGLPPGVKMEQLSPMAKIAAGLKAEGPPAPRR